MHVALIDYGAGNLRSAAKALERAARDSAWPGEVVVTRNPAAVRAAERVVLPGVGAFAECMRGLHAVPGLRAALEVRVIAEKAPFLGICVGMQLMAEEGIEFGRHEGLGWIKGRVVKIAPDPPSLKIPHTGWNSLDIQRPEHPVFIDLLPRSRGRSGEAGEWAIAAERPPPSLRDTSPASGGGEVDAKPYVYFVHSYHLELGDPATLVATADHGQKLTAAVGRANLVGTQFHPEKSQGPGLRLLANFLRWHP